MKGTFYTAAILVIASLCLAFSAAAALHADDFVTEFVAFKARYGKVYETAQEEKHRMRVFADNMRSLEELGAANPHATFGVTMFSDLTPKEFKESHRGSAAMFAAAVASRAVMTAAGTPLEGKATGNEPDAVDWREKGAVTPVKSQGDCGSCWAFATTGNIESQWIIAGNPAVSLSEQQFVSCDFIDLACSGGMMDLAMAWDMAYVGSVVYTEESYPYASGKGEVPPCDLKNRTVGAKIKGITLIQSQESAMANWLAENGPMAILVDAASFQAYKSGVLTNCISRKIDHAVLLVGYNDKATPPYWIIKNSWGLDWGEKGYIRVEKGTNQCLIKTHPMSAKV